MNGINPCACGGVPRLSELDSYFAIHCLGCGRMKRSPSKNEVIKNWNEANPLTMPEPATPTTRASILHDAEQCVCQDREAQYGSPEDNFKTIADLWKPYIFARFGADLDLKPHDVAYIMCLLKIGRIASGQAKADNSIDLAGYAACGGELLADIIEAVKKSGIDEQTKTDILNKLEG